MPDDCWACQLAQGDLRQHKTRWFYIGWQGAIVEDLNPKGYAMRLLFVPKVHLHCNDDEVNDMRKGFAKDFLSGFASALEIEEGLWIVKFDLDEHSFKDHWHAQACLERARDPANEEWD